MLPSRMFMTPSCLAISRRSVGTLSAKNAFDLSSLRLSNGNTAMLFSGIVVAAEIGRLGGADEAVTIFCREKNQAAEARISRTSTAPAASTCFRSGRGAAAGTAAATEDAPFVNFCGGLELPASSVYRLTTETRVPCLTSHSPKSDRWERHCGYCSRSSATRLERRI